MPSGPHHLPRRDSWPPTIISFPPLDESESCAPSYGPPYPTNSAYPTLASASFPSSSADLNIMDIDENPFSYFLESPSVEDYDDVDLSAGIESTSASPQEVREISPSSLPDGQIRDAREIEKRSREQSRRLKREREAEKQREDAEMDAWLRAPLSLRDFSERQSSSTSSSSKRSKSSQHSAVQRGRNVVRLSTLGGGRGRPRSISSPRPHSWRGPSPEISVILEGDEDMVMEEAEREATPGLLSDVGSGVEEMAVEPVVVRKRPKIGQSRKKVRWAAVERTEIDG